jgi:hypothetical protein
MTQCSLAAVSILLFITALICSSFNCLSATAHFLALGAVFGCLSALFAGKSTGGLPGPVRRALGSWF